MGIFTRLLLKFYPQALMDHVAGRIGLDSCKLDLAAELFGDCDRIDICRVAGANRGFILTLDHKLQLYFYQDGDRFVFDGFEIGEYESGDVTIFDRLGK